jgi:hypothetical protein
MAAQAVGTVTLQSVQTDNNHSSFGVIGHAVGRVTILLPKPGYSWDTQHPVATPGDFRVDVQ